MKKILVLTIFNLIICFLFSISTFSQSVVSELEKAKKFKLLETTREAVTESLSPASFDFGYSRSNDSDYFSLSSSSITATYSTGNCVNEEEDWNVSKGILTEISFTPKDDLALEDIGIDISKLKKKRIVKTRKNYFVYYSKPQGIIVTVRRDWVSEIKFLPSEQNYSQLCDKKETKEFYLDKKAWTRYPIPKNAIVDFNDFASVTSLGLSKTEIYTDCSSDVENQTQKCSDEASRISVSTTAIDPENDTLVYNYLVSGGKIVGTGAKVVWDLSGVKAGTYTLTVGVDDGCGICGKFITKTVTVKECPDCLPK